MYPTEATNRDSYLKGQANRVHYWVTKNHHWAQQTAQIGNNQQAVPMDNKICKKFEQYLASQQQGERKSYVREARDVHEGGNIILTENLSKIWKWNLLKSHLSTVRCKKIIHPHNDALVVSLEIVNNLVHRILIDIEASLTYLWKVCWTKWNWETKHWLWERLIYMICWKTGRR